MPGKSIILQLGGLEELQEALRLLPKELAAEGVALVDDAVEVTAAQLIQAYPLGDTGNLRRGVRRTIEGSSFGAVGLVKSTSPHAHLWEFGTESRKTKQNWFRGQQKPQFNKGLVGISIRNRRRMHLKLVELVKKAGFQVSGSF